MKKLLFILIASVAFVSCDKLYIDPIPEPVLSRLEADTSVVKFTLHSKRVPFIWKRRVEGVWVEDTIKVNQVFRYEIFDPRNYGYGYWVTMNLSGISTDSLYIKAECHGKTTQMSSLRGQSAAYVLIDNVRP